MLLVSLMTTVQDLVSDCVAALVESFPIEDIWMLEAKAAKECGLESPINLVLIVPDDVSSGRHRESGDRNGSQSGRMERNRHLRFSPVRYHKNTAPAAGENGSQQRPQCLLQVKEAGQFSAS